MRKLLFISHISNLDTSKGVRHQNLIKNLGKYFEITVVRHEVFISGISAVSASNSISSRFKKTVYRQVIRRFSFPDEFILIRRWYIKQVLSYLGVEKYDAIILGILPFSFYKLAGILKKTNPRIKLIIDLSDPFYGNVTIFFSRNPFLKALAKHYEKKYASLADHLVVLNEEIKSFYESVFGFENIVVIEQGFESTLAEPFKHATKLTKTSETNLVLVYGGHFYKKLREPFELYKAVEEYNKGIKLKLFGKISRHFLPKLSDKIEYLGRVRQEELFREYTLADILIFIDNAYGIQLPGKTSELMATGKPVLFISSNNNSPAKKYFQSYPYLIHVKNKSQDILKALESMPSQGIEKSVYNTGISAYYWENLIEKYLQIIVPS